MLGNTQVGEFIFINRNEQMGAKLKTKHSQVSPFKKEHIGINLTKDACNLFLKLQNTNVRNQRPTQHKKIDIQKSVAILYTINELSDREIKQFHI